MVNPYKDRMLIEYNIKKGGVNFGDVPPRPKTPPPNSIRRKESYMDYAQIITILEFKNYQLTFEEFKKLLPNLRIFNMYKNLDDNIVIQVAYYNENGINANLNKAITVIDLYLKEN